AFSVYHRPRRGGECRSLALRTPGERRAFGHRESLAVLCGCPVRVEGDVREPGIREPGSVSPLRRGPRPEEPLSRVRFTELRGIRPAQGQATLRGCRASRHQYGPAWLPSI